MKRFFSFDMVNGDCNLHKTKEEAINAAKECLDFYRDKALDNGWEEDLDGSIGCGALTDICKGEIIANKKNYTDKEWKESYNSDFDIVADYKIEEISSKNLPE